MQDAVANSNASGPTAWHTLSVPEVAEGLDANPVQGLAPAEAAARLQRYGENRIAEVSRRGIAGMFAAQLTDFMILVLVVAAVVAGAVGDPLDALAILIIVVLNAVVGVIQEYRAERAIEALRQMAAPEAVTRRAGSRAVIPAASVVPGDLVILEAGNVVPADLRLVQAEQLRTDESALTGESQAVDKTVAVLGDIGLPLGDRKNLAFRGSTIVAGRGLGLAVATGMQTELGRIAELLSAGELSRTPLQQRLKRFGQRLALIILAICAVILAAGLLRGEPPVLMFLTAVSLAVAAIPEALPAVVTVSLALGARKMIRRNALVRRLPAVETLGSVSFICADKTGTLTENRMRAELVQLGARRYPDLSGELAQCAPLLGPALALNNEVEFSGDGQALGDPTEVALLEFSLRGGFDKQMLEKAYPRRREIPFDSASQRMVTVHDEPQKGAVAFVKGAPEVVVPLCKAWAGEVAAFDSEAVLAQAEELAREGFRVLAVAAGRLRSADAEPEENLECLGLVALLDPPRPEVAQAVAECRSAGITPVMITGDHPGTALAIARRVGIADVSDGVITGVELAALDDTALAGRVKQLRVYARVNPEQKIRIVAALQAGGEFVAMTGDGVNDAPALKKANIGVAMGLKGTDVAREAADMVLLDDNFATIVGAVREGRRLFDNIRKFIKYTMTSNSGEIWTLFLAPFLGLPIPLLPIHILWINLVTDGLPGLALAAEPAEPGLMERPPRPPGESIFAHGMWQHMLWVGLLIGGLSILGQAWALGRGSENWQTVVFTVLTFAQLMQALSIRSDRESLITLGLLSNRPLLLAVLLSIVLQLIVIYVPACQVIFKTSPLDATELAACLLLPLVVLIAIELQKFAARRRSSRSSP